jgi:hypothetical protein
MWHRMAAKRGGVAARRQWQAHRPMPSASRFNARPVSGLMSGGSRRSRLPALAHSGLMTRLCSLTVAGAVPGLASWPHRFPDSLADAIVERAPDDGAVCRSGVLTVKIIAGLNGGLREFAPASASASPKPLSRFRVTRCRHLHPQTYFTTSTTTGLDAMPLAMTDRLVAPVWAAPGMVTLTELAVPGAIEYVLGLRVRA